MGVRFAVVGTMLRGALQAPEPLDESNEAAALSALEEASASEPRVVWRPGFELGLPLRKPLRSEGRPSAHVERMMRLAARRRW